MAAGFITKPLATLLATAARWVEFADASSAPVHGSIALDPATGLPIDISAATVVKAVADAPVSGTSTGLNGMLGPYDMSTFNALNATFTDIGAGNGVFAECHDDLNASSWYPAVAQISSAASTGGQAGIPAVGSYMIPRRARYIRFRNTTAGTGTVTMIGNKTASVPVFLSIGVGGSVFGSSTDAAWDLSASSASMIAVLKKCALLLEAIRVK